VLRDPNGVIINIGDDASSSSNTNEQLVKARILANFGSTTINPNDPQFIISTVNISSSQVTTNTTTLPLVQNLGNSVDGVKFYGLMDEYFDKSETYLKNVISNLMTGVRAGLPNVTIEGEKGVKSQLEGDI
jgi:hypothetical protein